MTDYMPIHSSDFRNTRNALLSPRHNRLPAMVAWRRRTWKSQMIPIHLSGRLLRVTSPTFVAGAIESHDGIIIFTAPISALQRLGFLRFQNACIKRGWIVEYAR